VFDRFRAVDRPFEDTAGIGEQMQVLNDRIENYHPPGQSDLTHYGQEASTDV